MGKFDDSGLEPICPWCGETLDIDGDGYDIALEAHVDDCEPYQSEQSTK